jgi:hypothetical protein
MTLTYKKLEELLQAVKTIKYHCEYTTKCEECPLFSDSACRCIFDCVSPNNIKLNEGPLNDFRVVE